MRGFREERGREGGSEEGPEGKGKGGSLCCVSKAYLARGKVG